MNLNQKVIEEMEKNPCVFRQIEHPVNKNKHTCLLTRLPFREPRHTTLCKPEKCPIWKGYVMQLMQTNLNTDIGLDPFWPHSNIRKG